MDCQDVRDQLVWYLIGELDRTDRDALDRHLAECTGCRWELENVRVMLSNLRARPAANAVRAELRERLNAAIRAEIAQARRRERRLQRLRWAAGMAAVLLVSLSLGALLWRHRAQEPSRADRDAELRELWRHEGISSMHTTTADAPAACGDSVYGLEINEEGRHVVCLDAKTGRPKWKSGAAVTGYLAADTHRAYAIAGGSERECRLLALDAENGRLVWAYEPGKADGGGIMSRPLLLGAHLCWCHGGEASFVAAETGKKVWCQAFPTEGVLSRPVAQGSRVWVATAKALCALDLSDGRIVWSKALSDRAARFSAPLLAVSADRCYVAMPSAPGRTHLLCYEPESDRVVWETTVARIVHLQIFGDTVIARSDCLRAWDGANGRMLWAYSAKGCSPVSPMGDNVCFVDVEGPGALITLEARTGRLIGRYAGKRSCAGLVVGKGIGYLNAQDGILYAVTMEKA